MLGGFGAKLGGIWGELWDGCFDRRYFTLKIRYLRQQYSKRRYFTLKTHYYPDVNVK